MATVRDTDLDGEFKNQLILYLHGRWEGFLWRDDTPDVEIVFKILGITGASFTMNQKAAVAVRFFAWGRSNEAMGHPMSTLFGSERIHDESVACLRRWARWMCRVARKREEHGLDPWGQTEWSKA